MKTLKKVRFACPDLEASERAEEFLEKQMQAKNSAGGIIECVVKGVPAGVGEPVFGKLDAALAQAVMSIWSSQRCGDWRWISGSGSDRKDK